MLLSVQEIIVIKCILFHVTVEHSYGVKNIVILQNSMDVLKGQSGTCSETHVTSSLDGNERIGIKVDEVTDIKDDEYREPMTYLLTHSMEQSPS